MDGVGRLESGERVFFGGCRAPYGAMAQRTVVPKAFVFPIPDSLSDEVAAALPNPGVSAWLTLTFRARLRRGENVLILGATGVTGQLAVTIAKLLGAGGLSRQDATSKRSSRCCKLELTQSFDWMLRLPKSRNLLRGKLGNLVTRS
jgi:NADPH:quinone reductase-like Zn-dependent oxidoreductase